MRKVENTIDIATSPEHIIKAFTDFDMLRNWWGVEQCLVEEREGGIYALAWNVTEQGFGYISAGIISKYHPLETLEIGQFTYFNPLRPILGPMRLIVQCKSKDTGTECYLCQDGYQEGVDWNWYHDAVQQAWPVVLKNLKSYLENRAK